MGLFDFIGKSKRQREIDKIIEESKKYLRDGKYNNAYIALKSVVYGKTKDDLSYRRDEVAKLFEESRMYSRTDLKRRDAKKESKDTATQCYEKAIAAGMSEAKALYKAAKSIDLSDKMPKDEKEAAQWLLQKEEAYSWYAKAADTGYE